MFKNYKKNSYSKTKIKLLTNFFSLSSMQIVSYILPLITIPYLVRVLGVEKFGLIAFAQTIIQYFVLFTDYGFGLSATKQVAEHRDNKNKVIEIFSSVLFIKFCMTLVSFFVLSLIVFNFEMFEKDWLLYYLTFGVAVGQAMFPLWYFQGIEKMHITALVNIVPKLIFTLCIFIFVQNKDDYLYVPLISSLGFIVAGLISLWLALYHFKVSFVFPTMAEVKHQLYEGWHVFLGGLSSNFSLLSVTFILGVLTTPVMVGYYAAVEKIIRPLASLSRPIINSIFPYLSSSAKLNHKKAYEFSRKISLYAFVFMFMIGIILFIFSDHIVLLVFGKEFGVSSSILKIMAFVPALRSLIDIYGIPNMIIFDLKKVYSKIMFFGLFFSLLTSLILVEIYAAEGAALSVLLTDIVILSLLHLYLSMHIKKVVC